MEIHVPNARRNPGAAGALARTLAREMRRLQSFKRLMQKKPPRLVVLAARGTSDNAALFGRYLLEITTGIPVSLAAPSIATLYQAPVDYRDALVVAISQSGESTDTNVVLERARAAGRADPRHHQRARRARMARLAEHVFLVRAGKERSVAATKTYTGQMLILYLLAHALGGGVRDARTWNGCPKRWKRRWGWSPRSRRWRSATGSCGTRWWWAAA